MRLKEFHIQFIVYYRKENVDFKDIYLIFYSEKVAEMKIFLLIKMFFY